MNPGASQEPAQPTPGKHARHPKAGSISQPLLFAASTYALGQVANFLFQLRLLYLLGPSQYGETGLAHLLLVTLIFLADLGYSSLFLRESGNSPDWQHTWRYALGHRLAATAALLAASALGWQLWGSEGASQEYLLWAAPACLLALFNYSSPMIAEGRRLAGLLVTQVAWPAALLFWYLLQDTLAQSMAATAGLSVSLGYLVQALVNVIFSRQLKLWLPLVGKGQIGAAVHLSLIGICGTLHDRLTPFLLAPLAPTFLPFFLILNHVLSGLSGIQAQLARLLLPTANTAPGQARILTVASLLLWGTATVLLAGLLIKDLALFTGQRPWLGLAAIVIFAWGISASSGVLATLLISARLEGRLMRLLVIGMTGSALLQIGAAWAGDAGYLLWARMAGVLAILVWQLKLLKLRFGLAGLTTLALSLLACVADATDWAMTIGTMLLLPILIGLLRQMPCYLPVRRAGAHP